MQRNFSHSAVIQSVLTGFTFSLAGICFYLSFAASSIPLLLLGLLTFGTAFDFTGSILGILYPDRKHFLLNYNKVNFGLLCFGILFTPMAAIFVIGDALPDGLSSQLAAQYPSLLAFSLLFGGMFLFARFKTYPAGGGIDFTLDKDDRYTYVIFFFRRILLLISLVMSLVVVIEGMKTELTVWSILFGTLFISTIPLHILHRKMASMVIEILTLIVLVYGSWITFAA